MTILRCHQASYDLLTQKPIDPQVYLDNLRRYIPADYELPPERKWWTTFDLYQRSPQISPTAVEQLDNFEARYGRKLPAAVREWYALDIGMPILHAPDNWLPTDIENFGELYPHAWADGVQLLDHDLLVFIGEQQGGNCCIQLDGSDDPRVYWIGDGVNHKRNPLTYEFELYASHFSDFIYCFLWDWLADYGRRPFLNLMSMQEFPLMRLEREFFVPLERLRGRFQEVQQQAGKTHRFYSHNQQFRVYPVSEDGEQVGPGMFYADSIDALQHLIDTIWDGHPPLKRLKSWEPQSMALLDLLRANF